MIMIDRNELHAMKTAARFDEFGNTRFPTMAKRAVEFGLEPADSIKSEGMSCFARTNLGPTYTSHETFLRSPFCEDIHKVSEYDVAVVGIPYDSGASNRSGTRLGPAGIRHASSQISPFNPDYGVDLYENIKLCDAGDIYTLPANAEKTFDQITKGIGYIFSQGVTPIVLGGDHSTTFPTLRGISKYIDGNIGVIHIDRHSDCDAIQMDEKMHGTEWYHSTHLPNLSAKNLVQIGIGGNCCKSWSKFTRDSGCTAISMEDIDKYGIDKVAELALDIAWKGCKAVYVSLDIDVLEAAFCPGTGTPDFGGMLPRELLRLLKLVTAPGICGMDVVEVSEYDVAVVGIPYDSGASNRSGTRLGPAGIRHASSQISPFNPDYGVDLYENIKLCDAGDIYTLPANAEKTFDQITKGIGYIFSQGVTPIVLGGDHSTTFPTLRGISKYIDGNIGVIHIDRHSDCDAIQMDEKMHGTEWYHSTHLPNLSAKNLVQIGIGGNCCKSWSKFTRDSGCTAISMEDIDKYGIDKVAELALDIAWKGCKAVYVSLDIDVLEAAFCPGTGTPDFGGMLPRELLRLLKLVTAPGICGMDVVEVSPPFDVSEITSLAASRCIINVLCNLALNKSLYKH